MKGGGSADVELVKGQKIKLSLNEIHAKSGDSSMIFVDYKNLCKVVDIDSKVLLSMGVIFDTLQIYPFLKAFFSQEQKKNIFAACHF